MRLINLGLCKSNTKHLSMSSVFNIILRLMATLLSAAQVYDLHIRHKKSRDKRVCDKIKAILMLNDGHPYELIVRVLLADDSTIRRWRERYQEDGIEGLLADIPTRNSFAKNCVITVGITQSKQLCIRKPVKTEYI